MKSEYDISTLKRKGHPLREKVIKGEITLTDPFDISDEEFNEKISALSLDEQEFVTNIRNEKYLKMIKEG
jgi:DNA-binding winged helix-turn-helix (wHTH) protein